LLSPDFFKNSETANNPIITGINSIPELKVVVSKVNLGEPVNESIPIVAKNNPNKTPINPLIRFFPLKEATTVNPITAREKYSGEEKFNANFESVGVRNVRKITPIIPPSAELKIAIPNARPAFPC